MRYYLCSLCLLLLVGVSLSIWAEEEPKVTISDIQVESVFSSTPQETLHRFSELMFSGNTRTFHTKDRMHDHTRDLAQALSYLEAEFDPRAGKIENENKLLQQANNLFFLIQSINYSPEEIVVKYRKGSQEQASMILTDSTNELEFFMRKTPENGWVFAKENFTDERVKAVLEHMNNIKENIIKCAGTFVPELSSPLNTLYTFYFGIQGLFGYDMEDAVKALDLSAYDAKVAKGQGPTWAIRTYRMLRYASAVTPESLSNDPNYADNIVLLLDRECGMINMSLVIDPVTKKKAWKIGYSGISGLTFAYDTMMRQGMAKKIGEMGVKKRTPHIILDDFFQQHFPSLENEFLRANIWKFLLLITLIIATIFLVPLTRIILLPLLHYLLKKLNISSNRDTNKRFILPLQICIISLLWQYCIFVISASPRVMLYTLMALNIVMTFTITLLLCRIIDSVSVVASNRVNTSLHILTSVLGKFLKIAIMVAAILYLCYIFNINTVNFLTALGIGGFAFALAGKDTIENFFGSIMVIVDKPFQNGEQIRINNIEGTIDMVSIRSTRIRTYDNTVITIPNRMFISSPVENLSIRDWRRYKTSFDILYETDIKLIKEFTYGLTELAHLCPDVKKDAIQVYLYTLDSSSLQIYVSLFFKNRGRVEELKARESFNTQALEFAALLGIEFAYPTQKLYITQVEPVAALQQSEPAQTNSEHEHTLGLVRQISPFYQPTAGEQNLGNAAAS